MLSSFRYLKPEKEYIDRYDLHTIEECLDLYWNLRRGMEKDKEKLIASEPVQDFDKEVHKCCSYVVRVVSINRYRQRKKTISKWIAEDRLRQDKIDIATPPAGIRCHKCGGATKIIDKNLHDAYGDSPRVSFIFECLSCQARQIFYEDGSPWDFKRPQCKKCQVDLKTKYDEKSDVLVTTTFCPSCDYKEEDVYDYSKAELERQKEAKRQESLLAEFRKEFCLDDTNGPDAVRSLEGMCNLAAKWESEERKAKDPAYQKARSLKKLRVNEVKKLLQDSLPEHGYVDLEFEKPELGRFVAVPFIAQDDQVDRSEYDSRQDLKKLIVKLLGGTNWRLMSDGISYRVGYLSGRLRCCEDVDDMIDVIEK